IADGTYINTIYEPVKNLVDRFFKRMINKSGTTKKEAIVNKELKNLSLNNLTGIQDFIAEKTKP
ncbi:MAG: hypothetical protein WCO71_00435, partial [Pseudomonadota bacterium]